MQTVIRDLTGSDLELFGQIIANLARAEPGLDWRENLLKDLGQLLRSDYVASFAWNPKSKRYEKPVFHNLDRDKMERYGSWFQFRDPLTPRMHQLRRASYVEQAIPRRDLEKTEFFNDFLALNGLHHGINLFLQDGGRDLADFRIWRGKGDPDFTCREISILNALEPFLSAALARMSPKRLETLTPREYDVARLVARGCTDTDICRILGIGFGTVRTHLNRILAKTESANRAELAAAFASETRS